MDVSVVVTTYNRAHLLVGTLLALSAQQVRANVSWEIVVVDNNSRDETKRVVDTFHSAVPVRYFFEPKQGQSYARNTGISHARGSVIAFTDDDVLPETNWVSEVWNTTKPSDIDGVGGRILPKWEAPVPSWLNTRPHLWGYLAMMDSIEPRTLKLPLVDGAKIWGANMAYKKRLFDDIGLFDTDRGNVARKLYRGEETDLVIRALSGGKKLVYEPQLVVRHRVGPERMKKAYFRKVVFDGGENAALQLNQVPGTRLLGVPRWLFSIILKESIDYVIHGIASKEDAFERQLYLLDDVGKLWGFWKRSRVGR